MRIRKLKLQKILDAINFWSDGSLSLERERERERDPSAQLHATSLLVYVLEGENTV
jgi:hypothetical protein